MHTPNLVDENIQKIGGLFPNCLTETKDENGKAYAYRDAAGNYYEYGFGLRY